MMLSMRFAQRLLVIFLAVAALCAESFSGKVVAITDGDTIKVMHNGQAERIRLWGIDCLESHQAFGKKATRLTGIWHSAAWSRSR